MKSFLTKVLMSCNVGAMKISEIVAKHKRAIMFSYLFALLTSCFSVAAYAATAEEDYPLWATVDAVLDIIFPIIIIVGVILVIVGIILFFIQKFNEQSITGPLIIIAVGIGLILIRALLGDTISWIAFHQMYPKAPKTDFETLF